MSETPKNNGRKPDGRFAPGNGLGGRTPGARNKTTLAVEALLEGEHESLKRVENKRQPEFDGDLSKLSKEVREWLGQ